MMRVWALTLFGIIWMWYLYYAFPNQHIIENSVYFVRHVTPSTANTTIQLIPYRSYNVEMVLILPRSHYNHNNVGNVDIEINLIKNGVVVRTTVANILTRYQSYVVEVMEGIVGFIPYMLGVFSMNQEFRLHLLTDYMEITTGKLDVGLVIHQPNLRIYSSTVVFREQSQSLTQIMLYVALAIGFTFTGVTIFISQALVVGK